MAVRIGNETYTSYEEYIQKNINFFERIGDMLSGLDERLDYLNKTALRMEALLKGEPLTEIIPSPEYKTFIRENVNIFEKVGDALTGADERLDFLNDTFLRIEQVLKMAPAPPTPPAPPIEISLADIIKSNIALDIRSFLIMLYRLGRAREVRLFSYVAVDAGGTETYTYAIPTDYIYIPHIEEVDLGLQRTLTRYDYEGGNLLHSETYATDRTIEWTMTPLSRVIEGSFAVSFYNGGTTDTWVKSRFLGSIMRQSDYLMWRQLIRDLSEKYLKFGA